MRLEGIMRSRRPSDTAPRTPPLWRAISLGVVWMVVARPMAAQGRPRESPCGVAGWPVEPILGAQVGAPQKLSWNAVFEVTVNGAPITIAPRYTGEVWVAPEVAPAAV